MASVTWHGDAILAGVEKAAKEGCHMAAEKVVLPKWSKMIPHATGDLESHLTVFDTEDGAGVSSGGPPAARQEFDETLRHPDPTNPLSLGGRKAHAGRDALLESKDAIAVEVAKAIKGAL